MPEATGTKVGNVYLDLQVRDTIAAQLKAMAGQGTGSGTAAVFGHGQGRRHRPWTRGLTGRSKSGYQHDAANRVDHCERGIQQER